MTDGRVCLPIFPLPDITFFPHTVLPLHIFEPRYRSMISDSLARNRKLAVVGLKPGYEDNYEGKPAVHAIAGAGEIVRCERLATGRFNVLLKGERRVRIDREVPSDTLYRLVEATVLDDVGDGGSRAAALTSEIKGRCRRVLNAVGRSSPRLEAALSSSQSPAILADQIASALIPSPPLRQRLLEETDVEQRLRLLLTSLDRLLERLDRGR